MTANPGKISTLQTKIWPNQAQSRQIKPDQAIPNIFMFFQIFLGFSDSPLAYASYPPAICVRK
jgi:hypothetical protein